MRPGRPRNLDRLPPAQSSRRRPSGNPGHPLRVPHLRHGRRDRRQGETPQRRKTRPPLPVSDRQIGLETRFGRPPGRLLHPDQRRAGRHRGQIQPGHHPLPEPRSNPGPAASPCSPAPTGRPQNIFQDPRPAQPEGRQRQRLRHLRHARSGRGHRPARNGLLLARDSWCTPAARTTAKRSGWPSSAACARIDNDDILFESPDDIWKYYEGIE